MALDDYMLLLNCYLIKIQGNENYQVGDKKEIWKKKGGGGGIRVKIP